MKVSDVKKVCVAGGGQMGRQIALNAAIHGFDTYLTDAIADVLTAVNKCCLLYTSDAADE